ncbi:MAG: hypothetical protein WBN81_02650 [Gammaproteobacteria bacterium]
MHYPVVSPLTMLHRATFLLKSSEYHDPCQPRQGPADILAVAAGDCCAASIHDPLVLLSETAEPDL